MKIAIEGCCHGRLDDIYGSIRLIEQRDNCKIDLLLICGDFQSVRNEADLKCMSVPEKYLELGTFWKYYSGKARAPYPTIFIGGNHEASNYLWELYHGGWVCDNIYYLGNAGVINFGGLRIGGLSGIEKQNHYKVGHFEESPYNAGTVRSVYHVREYDVKKLLQVQEPLDIFLSHDWPRGVERYGNLELLMKFKKHFIDQIKANDLGSYANETILTTLKPSYWFAAHLHIHYAAIVDHDMLKNKKFPPKTQEILDRWASQEKNMSSEFRSNSDYTEAPLKEDVLDASDANLNENTTEDEGKEMNYAKTNENSENITKFLSLDKCLPRRQFLQIIDIPSTKDDEEYDFYYDMEWLSITRAMQPYLSTEHQAKPIPSDEELKQLIEKERVYLEKKKSSGALDLKIPHNFEPTAPAHDPNNVPSSREFILTHQFPYLNPQTVQFCQEIDIENKVNVNCPQKPNSEQSTIASGADMNDNVTNDNQPSKRVKIGEDSHSEIVIDDEFL
ncbi:MAG: lariat debranching enzyme, C-terminal domain-containing protein [Benjaminiella poitrasii]|nr:MAG: lariat debranching enzyme, C-terminal domain-containing protein [Benjaminiella poitrasii]